jgi:uncharacterized membrane protein YphA (DoxX/SURF4 family)
VLTGEVPAAAEVAAAKAAHVPAAKAAAEAAHVAEVSAGEMTAAELAAAEAAHVAEVSAGEMSPASMEGEATVEAVVEMVPSDEEDRTAPPIAIVVIRIRVAPTVVVAGASALANNSRQWVFSRSVSPNEIGQPMAVRPVIVAVAVRIAGGGADDHSGRDGRAGIITLAVNVAMSVSPNVVAVACVAMCDIPVQAV